MCINNKVSFQILIFVLVASLFGIWLVFVMPDTLSHVLKVNWICDVICMEISLFVLLFMYIKRMIDFFSPVIYVSFIYILMFYITPVYDISIGETSVFGVTDLFDYGAKSSVIALLGFMSFCVVYSYQYQKAFGSNKTKPMLELSDDSRTNLEYWLLIAWIADFILAIVITVATKGFSISYILSFGMVGDSDTFETTQTSLGFIGQFTRSIVTIYLLYNCISRNDVLKRILLVLTMFLEIIHGFRYMVVILICGYFYFSYLRKKRKVRATHVLLLLLLLAIVVGVVGYSRNSVRAGAGFSMDDFSMDDIIDAVIGNFRIYKSYYAIVKAVPSMTGYIYFDQIFMYTIIMIVPRAIWPQKPGNPGTKAQLYGLNQAAVSSGFAYPCLGEYYYSFGTIGVVFFMGVIGHWLANAALKYRVNSSKDIDLVIYSVTVAMMLQLLIRGYTPGNFYLVLALYIPYWIVDSYYKKYSYQKN